MKSLLFLWISFENTTRLATCLELARLKTLMAMQIGTARLDWAWPRVPVKSPTHETAALRLLSQLCHCRRPPRPESLAHSNVILGTYIGRTCSRGRKLIILFILLSNPTLCVTKRRSDQGNNSAVNAVFNVARWQFEFFMNQSNFIPAQSKTTASASWIMTLSSYHLYTRCITFLSPFKKI